MLKIIIFCSQSAEYEKQKAELVLKGFFDAEFVFGNSREKSREQLINENLNSWNLFLDHDCVPTCEAYAEVQRIIKLPPLGEVFAGLYEDPPGATSLQSAHNAIANTWLEESYSENSGAGFLLGGIFLIYAIRPIKLPEKMFWGAEDKLLATHLKDAGFSLKLNRSLKAIHDTSKSFGHFIRRAALHGKNDALYFDQEKGGSKLSYWIQKTDFSNLRLMPLILLHFCIQKGAKAAQRVLR